ncbi:MAG TPA: helix-turn-helix domain-containing protein, partial [Rubrivivax sp.]|nr:helix-turn-helix domain-containing protein [Rubrivivax sp.]
TDDPSLGAAHFAPLLGAAARAQAAASPAPAVAAAVVDSDAWTPLPQAVAELEARCIRQALQRTGGNKLAAARLLGISRATLYQKLPAATHNATVHTEQLTCNASASSAHRE